MHTHPGFKKLSVDYQSHFFWHSNILDKRDLIYFPGGLHIYHDFEFD